MKLSTSDHEKTIRNKTTWIPKKKKGNWKKKNRGGERDAGPKSNKESEMKLVNKYGNCRDEL